MDGYNATLSLKRNATFLHGFVLGPTVRVTWPWIMGHLHIGFLKWRFWQVVTLSIVEMMDSPRFTGIHSSPKERQLRKCCVSFEKECTYANRYPVHSSNRVIFTDQISVFILFYVLFQHNPNPTWGRQEYYHDWSLSSPGIPAQEKCVRLCQAAISRANIWY